MTKLCRNVLVYYCIVSNFSFSDLFLILLIQLLLYMIFFYLELLLNFDSIRDAHKKNNFAEISKNLARYKSENNFVGSSK